MSAVTIVLDALERKGGRIGDFVSSIRKEEEKKEVITEVEEALTYNHGPGKLHDAIKIHDNETVTALLDNNYDCDEIDSRTGYSALHVAAMSSNKHAAIALLKRGCELFYLTKTGNTSLHLAVQNDEPLIIRKIVESAFQRRRANELVLVPDRKGATVLDMAQKRNLTHIIYGIRAKIDEERFVFGVESIFKQILADPQSESQKHNYGQGRSPLHFICLHGGHEFVDNDLMEELVQMVPKLVKFGADPNDKDSEGRTPLMCACFGGAIRMVKAMLRLERVKKKRGKKIKKKLVKIDMKDPIGWTALLIAVDRCKLDCIEYLLRKDADVELPLDLGKQTCLHIAAQRCELPGAFEAMEALISYGANPGALNAKNQSIIDICNMYGKAGRAMIEMLEEALMDASIRQYRVNTLIEEEVNEDDIDEELLLLDGGEDDDDNVE